MPGSPNRRTRRTGVPSRRSRPARSGRRSTTATERLFAGAGEILARCRSIDWEKTPLGAVEGWSPALRTAVRVCLESRTAMAVWAGPELTLIHNDGFRSMLASESPCSLGRSAAEVWPEVWDMMRTELQDVLDHAASTRHEDVHVALQRSGLGADAYFTYSFTPIREDDGRVSGVLNVVEETTRIVKERREHEEFLSFALATAGTGAWDLDLVDHTARRSPQHDSIFGYEHPPAQWTYEMFLEHVLPEDRPELDRKFRLTVESGGEWSFECRIARCDGEIRWIWVAGNQRIDEYGHPRLAGIVQDVTERKRRDVHLAFLGEVADHFTRVGSTDEIMREVGARVGLHLGIDSCSFAEIEEAKNEMRILHRWQSEELAPLPDSYGLADYGGEELRRAWREKEMLVVRDVDRELGGEARRYASLGIRAFVVVPFRLRAERRSLLSVGSSRPRDWRPDEIVLLQELATSVFPRLERARAEEALSLSELKFRSLFQNLPDAVLLTVPEGRIVAANPAACAMFGMTEEEIVRSGRDPLVDRDDPRRATFLEAHRLSGEVADGELSFVRKNGQRFPGEVTSALLGRGELAAFVIRDITKRKEAQARLEEADRRKNEFLAILSHELRNPLTPVKNCLYILDRTEPGGERSRRAREVISRQIGQLSHLVDDLLDVTRITRGKIQLQRRRLELNDLVRRTLEDHRSLFDRAGLEVRFHPETGDVVIDADWNRIAQVISNLLQNAAKFTPRGGRVATEVEVDRAAAQAVVRIADTGPGIAPEIQERLFEPFMQADATLDRTQGGLGLGLALVKGLVEQHGGSIEARSDGPGRGAEFTVRLPLVLGEEREELPAPGAPTPVSRRILVIEDNVDAAESLREVLELNGHRVEVAHDGASGIARARVFHPEVVLCDLGLPGMDGFAVARVFRADEALRQTHLIALSGYALPEDLQRSAEAGFERHLAKPPNVERLESALAALSS